MTRKLVPMRRFLEDFEEGGEDPDTLYIDPDDIAEVEETETEEN
jgi:hypothetical protein